MKYISRNPFARETLFSERVYKVDGCAWCAQSKATKDHMHSYLFRYFLVPDTGARHQISGDFCSVGCARSYHDGRF